MIFEDSTGLRWKITRGVAVFALAGAILLAASVALSIWKTPVLAPLAFSKGADPTDQAAEVEDLTDIDSGPRLVDFSEKPDAASAAKILEEPFLKTAFIVQDDPHSVSDLKRNIKELHIVFPDWYRFETADGDVTQTIKPEVAHLLAENSVVVMPRISNTDRTGAWKSEEVLGELFRNAKASETFMDSLIEKLKKDHAQGVNIDIEELEAKDTEAYVTWLETFADALHREHLLLSVDVPLNDEAFDFEAIGKICDLMVLMAYDQSYTTSKPGPIASQDWFEEGLEDKLKQVPANKLIVALGTYGYDWNVSKPKSPAVDLGFYEALDRAATKKAKITTQGGDSNSHFSYTAADGKHEVHFLDAVSAWNQYLFLTKNKVRGVSLWRLGLEDPTIWDFLSLDSIKDFNPESLEEIPSPHSAELAGEGELFRVRKTAKPGRRTLTWKAARLMNRRMKSSQPPIASKNSAAMPPANWH